MSIGPTTIFVVVNKLTLQEEAETTMTLNELLRELNEAKKNLPQSAARFNEILGQVVALNDPATICPLALLLPHDERFSELMLSIIHLIERFEDELYIREILKCLPQLRLSSPYWTAIIHVRIFNNPNTLAEYKKAVSKGSSSEKEVFREVLEEVSSLRPKTKSACDEIKQMLS